MPIYNAPIYNFVTGNVKGSDVAFNKLTTGNNDVALGTGVMGNVTTGSFNIGVGNNSLAAVTTGGSNICVGSTSGTRITTGFNNTYAGDASGAFTVVGHDNTCIGANVFSGTGSNNVALGSSALDFLTPGDGNTAIGTNSLDNQISGNNNTGLGLLSGNTISTGQNCTFIGANADLGVADTGFSFATAIGAGATVSQSNAVVLGRSAGQDVVKFSGPLQIGTPAGANQAGQLFMGAGAPNNANGNNGDYYFNTTGAANTHIYFKSAGTWAGII